MNRRAGFVFVPRSPESVSHHALLESLEGGTVLHWYLRWLQTTGIDFPVYVICHGRIRTEVQDICRSSPGVDILCCDLPTQMEAVLHGASVVQTDECVVLCPGMGFAPRELLSKVLLHHETQSNHQTWVTGLPGGFTPEVHGPQAIEFLRRFPQVRESCSSLVVAMELIRKALLKRNPKSGDVLPCKPFDAARWLPFLQAEELPEAIDNSDFEFPRLARRALQIQAAGETGCGGSELMGLRAWKKARLEELEEHRAVIRAMLSEKSAISKESPRRILYVQTAGGFSGAEEALCRMIANLDPRRFEPHAVVGSPGLVAQKLREAGAEVHVAGTSFADVNSHSVSEMIKAVRRVHPRIVHVNGIAEHAAALVASMLDLPLIEHARVNRRWYGNHCMTYADRVIAVSHTVRNSLLQCNIPSDRIAVVYDGVEAAVFEDCRREREAARSRAGISQQTRVLALIARFDPSKRHDLALQCLALLREKLDACLLIAGEACSREEISYRAELERMAERLGIVEHVRFLGFQQSTKPLLAAADTLLLCSDEEPLGICVLEAMAAGVPTVVTESCGVAELLENGVNSLLVPSNDAASLAQAVFSIFSCQSLVDSMRAAAYAVVQGQVGARQCAEQIERLYEQCLGSRRPDTR